MAIQYFGENDLKKLILLIYAEFNKYQLAEDGKGLSQEDFTTELKEKLEGIDLELYSTTEEMNEAIEDAIKDVTGISFDGPYESYEELVATVTTPKVGVIYLVKNAGTDHNVMDEYFWRASESKFEKFGSTAADLSNYIQKSELLEMTAEYVENEWNKIFS